MIRDGWSDDRAGLSNGDFSQAIMVWTIHIVKDTKRYVHVANELHAALAVACIFLRSGIGVEQIEGPEGEHLGVETIQEFCDADTWAGKWRRSRLKFLSQ
jgi:hypothetical protein